MSMHNKPLTTIEEAGLIAHGLGRDIGRPSMAADIFRHGVAWGQMSVADQIASIQKQLDHGMPFDQNLNRRLTSLLAEMVAPQQPNTSEQEDAPFIPWNGGPCPVKPLDIVEYKMRGNPNIVNESEAMFIEFGYGSDSVPSVAEIIAYRVKELAPEGGA